MMDELHKLFLGMIAVLVVLTIMFSTAIEIQEHNRAYLETIKLTR